MNEQQRLLGPGAASNLTGSSVGTSLCLMLLHCFLMPLLFLGEPGEPQEMHSIYQQHTAASPSLAEAASLQQD